MNAVRIAASLCFATVLNFTAPVRAAEDAANYPSRPVRLVVGFAAGGGNDILARLVGQKLSERIGRPVVIENKAGAGGMIATEYVARVEPDGYTLLVGASGAMTISPAVYDKVNYDTLRDFIPISAIGSFPLFLIVRADSPFKTVADLVSFAKANPDKTNYASSSAAFQLATELFKQKTDAPMQMIPYRSSNESVTAVISGDVTATIVDPGPVMSQITGGQVRALAVAAPARTLDLPDVPTMTEAGAGFEAILWSGIFAPKGTPPAIAKKLQDELMSIVRLPDVAARLKQLSTEPVGNSSEEFARIIAADIARWTAVARSANIRLAQ
jgi:tripartite-type tricarboxylate transporter receptor subunit TctC